MNGCSGMGWIALVDWWMFNALWTVVNAPAAQVAGSRGAWDESEATAYVESLFDNAQTRLEETLEHRLHKCAQK